MDTAQVTRNRRYSGVVNLSVDLPVVPEALGLRQRVRVGGRTVELALPLAPDPATEQDEAAALEAPVDAHTFGALHQRLRDSYAGGWGYVSGARICYVQAAAISVALPPSQDSMATSKDLIALGRHLAEWLEAVRLWASAWVQVPLVNGGGPFSSTVHLADRNHLAGSGSFVASGRDRGSGPVLVLRQGLDAAQVRAAFRWASAGDRPPLPLVLLLAAKQAQWAGDRRQAVIDAATAVEVALADQVRQMLHHHRVTGDFIDAAILQANGVVGLITLFNALGGNSPLSKAKLASEVAQPRNAAAHAGVTPTPEVAERVHTHARSIVTALTQLPQA